MREPSDITVDIERTSSWLIQTGQAILPRLEENRGKL
jgi:hypothetical protein